MATSDISYSNLYEGLATLDAVTGKPPDTRMQDPAQVRDVVVRAIRYDMQYRDWKRSRIKGLVDGNPPYLNANLVAAGRGDECNVNWRHAKFFLTTAQGMLYDTFSEGETFTTVELDEDKIMSYQRKHGAGEDVLASSPDQVVEWSHNVTEQFDLLQRTDPDFDWNAQQSQGQCVLYGTGPMVFEDELDWRPWSFESRCLLVPEWAKSNTNKWEWAGLIVEYSPDKLYHGIVNPEAAQKRGWDVAATRRAIMNAHPLTRTGVMYQNWSWHQDLLKNGTYFYADQSKMIRTAHFYFREFPEKGENEGRITECMIDLDGLAASETGKLSFLFLRPRKYANWRECIHPMYWAHDVNGYHHSVTGLGIEMFGALEYLNRLFCRTADDAFAPKLFFKPTVASERERMSIAQVGRYGILPAALDMIQQHVQPMLQDGIAMNREVLGMVQSNLSQFRSNALTKQQGNPVTARQIDYEASEQAKMGNTQLNRWYEQQDWLYDEKYRRATNPALTKDVRGGAEAIEFVEACKRKGVPPWALRLTKSVRATRVTGQGSAYMRQQALEFLMGLAAMFPESGRTNLVRDIVASRAGQSKVNRYMPRAGTQDTYQAEQQAAAMLQVASMKIGIPPIPAPTQNPAIYAETFTKAAEGAAQAVRQGANPHDSSAFMDLAIPAAQTHTQRMAGDKTREQQVKQLMERLGALASFNDQLKGKLQQQAQEQAQAQQQMAMTQAGQDPETQVGLAKVEAKHNVDMAKFQLNAGLKAQAQRFKQTLELDQHQTDKALADADTAAGIHRDTALTRSKIVNNGAAAHSNGKEAKE